MIRTSEKIVTFLNAFSFPSLDEQLPAGDYKVQTDEELIEGLSFVAYRRVETMIYLRGRRGRPGERRILSIDPDDLNTALEADDRRSRSLALTT